MQEILMDNQDALIVRKPIPTNHLLSLLNEIYIEPGTKEDWELLHELHYKADTLGIGPRYWRVFCMAKLSASAL